MGDVSASREMNRKDADLRLREDFTRYLNSEALNWSQGIAALIGVAERWRDKFDHSLYEKCIAKIAISKPFIRGNEERYFRSFDALPMERIKRIVETATKDVGVVMSSKQDYAKRHKTKGYKVGAINNLDDLRSQVREVLGSRVGMFSDFASRRFVTFGSCFANNISIALRERGASVHTMVLTEDVNSTFTNKLLLRHIFLGEKSRQTEELQKEIGSAFDSIGAEFSKATDIIMTLGNIFHLDEDGAKLIADTMMKTHDDLFDIIALLREHTKARLFISVSPIPISGYRGDDYETVVEADAASKAQLLTALRSLIKYIDEYIPTFEIFKWLPPHQSFASFGTDDGTRRHLAQAHVRIVMEELTCQ